MNPLDWIRDRIEESKTYTSDFTLPDCPQCKQPHQGRWSYRFLHTMTSKDPYWRKEEPRDILLTCPNTRRNFLMQANLSRWMEILSAEIIR